MLDKVVKRSLSVAPEVAADTLVGHLGFLTYFAAHALQVFSLDSMCTLRLASLLVLISCPNAGPDGQMALLEPGVELQLLVDPGCRFGCHGDLAAV